jgi:hypothetical protein
VVHTGYIVANENEAQQQVCACQGCGHSKKQVAAKSWFAQWFVVEQGVISICLRNMTIVCGVSITVALLLILYFSCNDGTGRYVCTYAKWPMISDVINQEMYNRTFILLTAVFMYGVQQANLRAFYKMLYGKINVGRNDTMMYIGIASMVALPMVGIFDEHNYSTFHGLSAGIFFIGFMIYARMLAISLDNVKDQFDAETQASIKNMYNNVTGLILTTLAFFVSLIVHHSGGITAILEWATTFYFVNFFAIASFTNTYYDSVHEPGKLIPKKA